MLDDLHLLEARIGAAQSHADEMPDLVQFPKDNVSFFCC